MELFIFLNQLSEIGSFFKADLTLSRGAPVCRGTVVEHPWSRNQHVRYRRPLYVQNRKCILMHPIVTTTTKTTTELFTDAHTRERSSHELLCKSIKKNGTSKKTLPIKDGWAAQLVLCCCSCLDQHSFGPNYKFFLTEETSCQPIGGHGEFNPHPIKKRSLRKKINAGLSWTRAPGRFCSVF